MCIYALLKASKNSLTPTPIAIPAYNTLPLINNAVAIAAHTPVLNKLLFNQEKLKK